MRRDLLVIVGGVCLLLMAGRVRVSGAQVVDWEDIAVGPCGSGSCVYIGDIGDNNATRQAMTIYRVPEPAPRDPATAPADALRAVCRTARTTPKRCSCFLMADCSS